MGPAAQGEEMKRETMPNVVIDEALQQLLPVLSPGELELLEKNLLTEGCRDPLVVWEEKTGQPPVLLDGHNRYAICTAHNLPFTTVAAQGVRTREAAIIWIGANQLGRRNLDASRKAAFGVELEKQLAMEAKKRQSFSKGRGVKGPAILPDLKGDARDQAAEIIGVSPRYISEAKQIQETAPEVLEYVKQGKLTIPQAVKVAALPVEKRAAGIQRARNGEAIQEGGMIWRDGGLVPVFTNEEVSVWLRQTSMVERAVKDLGTMHITMTEFFRTWPPFINDNIAEHLDAAEDWFQQFVNEWRKRYGKKAA